MVNRFIKTFTITLILWCIIIFLIPVQINASPLSKALQLAEKLELKNHPVWLKLIHYEKNSNTSVVLTDNFFLSPNGWTDPEAELKATINAYFIPQEKPEVSLAVCRFPARYYWLSHHIFLPGYSLKNSNCNALNNWGLQDKIKSVSLLLVSGYLGNPASTFGHTFLKLNSSQVNNYASFFDSTLNYGAVVPENENTVSYIIRGLSGGYQAGFSDKYFYTQDLVYSNTEFRDIWDYQLILSEYERTLLILHIWEIVGNKFTYYFLNKNCAYRLGELIDLVIEEDIIDDQLWYFPVELFHKLESIDKARKESINGELIHSINYIPSTQRKLYSQLKVLTSSELKIFNIIVQNKNSSLQPMLDKLAPERQILLLDCLLAYHQYKIITEQPYFNRLRHEEKKQTLLSRLQLPIHETKPLQIPERLSPAKGSQPMEIGISIGTQKGENSFLILNWSPYKKLSVGNNSMPGDEFVLADFAIGFNKDKTFIDRFDLIHILNLDTSSIQIEDENHLSWEIRLGIDRLIDHNKERYDGILNVGAGYAWQLNPDLTFYGMFALAGHTISYPVRVRPYISLRFDLDQLKAWIYGGIESSGYDLNFSEIWGGKLQYHFNTNYAVQINFSNETATELSIGLSTYW